MKKNINMLIAVFVTMVLAGLTEKLLGMRQELFYLNLIFIGILDIIWDNAHANK